MFIKKFVEFEKALTNVHSIFHLYYFAAILPFSLYFLVAITLDKELEINVPDYGFILSSILIIPFMETLIFCWPVKLINTSVSNSKKSFIFCFLALTFASAHFIFSEREIWTFAVLFWTGIVYLCVFDKLSRLNKLATMTTTYIHTAYNATATMFVLSAYYSIKYLEHGNYLISAFIIFYLLSNAAYLYFVFRGAPSTACNKDNDTR